MAVERFTCPECHTTLKPSKPIAEGKKVKCPKCSAVFTVPPAPPAPAVVEENSNRLQLLPEQGPAFIGLAPLDPPGDSEVSADTSTDKQKVATRPAHPASAGKKARAVQGAKAQASNRAGLAQQKSPPQPAKEHGAPESYGLVDEPENKEEDSQSKLHEANKQNYDPRGPAQAAVVRPANLLLITGGVGALGWGIISLMIVVLVLFPLPSQDDEVPEGWQAAMEMGPGVGTKHVDIVPADPPGTVNGKAPKPDPGGPLGLIGLGSLLQIQWWVGLLVAIALLLPAAYCGMIAIGAVKAHNLESRGWGMIASVMAMVPITVGGWLWLSMPVVAAVVSFCFGEKMGLLGWAILIIVAGLECAWGVRVGMKNIATLMHPEVIEGFEYRSE